jgi:hypothetical protein
MRSFTIAGLFIVFSGLLLAAMPAAASQPGTPPSYLPPGSGYLDTSTRIANVPHWVPGPNYRVKSNNYYKMNLGSVSRKMGKLQTRSATPIQLPAPRSAVKTSALKWSPVYRAATPLPLPKPNHIGLK